MKKMLLILVVFLLQNALIANAKFDVPERTNNRTSTVLQKLGNSDQHAVTLLARQKNKTGLRATEIIDHILEEEFFYFLEKKYLPADSVFHYVWDFENDEWLSTSRYANIYDAQGRLVEKRAEEIVLTVNWNNETIQSIMIGFVMPNGAVMYFERMTITYNSESRITSLETSYFDEEWISELLVLVTRTNNATTFEVFEGEDQEFEFGEKFEYLFNDQQRLDGLRFYEKDSYYNHEDWVLSGEAEALEWFPNGDWAKVYFMWYDSYDDEVYEELAEVQAWHNFARFIPQHVTISFMYDDEWYPIFRIVENWNEQGHSTGLLEYYWNDDTESWDIEWGTLSSYVYSSQNHILEEVISFFLGMDDNDDPIFLPIFKVETLFDNATSTDQIDAPVTFFLHQNYPNPFNPITTITYTLDRSTHISLEVFDITGRRVAVLDHGLKTDGQHQVRFDGSQLSSGFYLYRLQAGEFSQVKRMMLIK